jgi:hypothetical protein
MWRSPAVEVGLVSERPEALAVSRADQRVGCKGERVPAETGSPRELDVRAAVRELLVEPEVVRDSRPHAAVPTRHGREEVQLQGQPLKGDLAPPLTDRAVEPVDLDRATHDVRVFARPYESGKPAGIHDVVRVAEHEELPACRRHADIPGVVEPPSGAGVHDPERGHAPVELLGDVHAPVGAAVVDDEQFPFALIVLPGKRDELVVQEPLAVQHRQYDADEAGSGFLPRGWFTYRS